MSYIVEVKKKESVQVGERYGKIDMGSYSNSREAFPIMEERISPMLRQEVESLNLQELVKLLNNIS